MQRTVVFLIAFLISANLFSIQNKFEFLTPDNGLSQANVECILQDSQGFIWIGTFNGLNRYDGYEIRIFNHDPNDTLTISHEHVTSICEDDEGKLWLATYGGGISVYYPETETFRRITHVRSGSQTVNLRSINMIEKGPEGNIWAADENQGVFAFNTNCELIKYYINEPSNPKSIPGSFYFGMVFDKEGNGWFGVNNNLLCLKEKNSDDFKVYRFEDRIASNDDGIRSMYIDRSDNIWIGTTSQGAYKFNPETEQFVNYRKESDQYQITANTIMSFAEDSEGNVLIGTDGGGLNIIDNSTGAISVIQYDPGIPESLASNAVYAIYFDKSLNLWLGTYAAGVNFQSRYKNKFKKYTSNPLNPKSLSYKNVTAVLQDHDGEIWIGTDGGGLNRFDPLTEEFEHFRMDLSNPDWLHTDVIISLMEDDEGDIYISSYNHGLTIFNKNEMKFKQYLPDDTDPTSLAGIHPWYTFQDSYGTIWVGMLAVGLDKFDKSTETFSHYISDVNDPTTLNSPNIKIIYEDRGHRLWIGTEGGGLHLYNREEDNFTRYYYDAAVEGSLSNDDVRALYEDRKGRFWVGTGKGLCQMDRENGTFTCLYTDDGLPGNTIDGILEDHDGYLWLSTDAGISRFSPKDMTFKNYDKTDGLQGNEFNYTASMVTYDGNFYFGGKNGFNVFKPEDIKDNPYPPDVVITEIEVLNQPYTTYEVKSKGKKVKMAVTHIKKLKLSYKQNILSFKFAALDYGNSVKNQYKYILEGFDKDWNTTNANKRFATYTNLPGGDYVFKVIASNGDEVWNKEGIAIDITITPPFYKRTWFIILVIAFIVWFLIRYIRRREEVLKKDKEILENKIQEGLKEVNKQKEEVAQKDKILQEKIESEKEQNWYNIGMSKMSEVMSKNKDDLHQLAQSIITEMVEYIEVQQGAMYLLNDEDEGDNFLELMAAYAPDEKRLIGNRIELEEGQVGMCYKEMSVIKIDNLPDDYATFSSGLGEANLKHLAVIPLRLNEIVIGVVELLSYSPIPQYRIEFVEKSGETLTSILTALKANFKTQKLLEQQKLQAEELAAQEEELRQNLEEMQATQEELGRMKEIEKKNEDERRISEKKLMDKLQQQNDELKKNQIALEKEQYLFNALLDSANEHIYFKDKQSRFIRLSHSMLKLFSVKSFKEILGKSDFDFFDNEHAQPAFDDEQRIIKTGKAVVDKVEKEVHKDGSISWASTSKMPLKDMHGKIVGTWGISKDITETKNLEDEINKSKEKLLVYENMLHTLINNLPGRVVVTDSEGIVYKANDAFARSLKKKMKDVENITMFNLLRDKEQKKNFEKQLAEVKKKGKIEWTEADKSGVKFRKQLIKLSVEELKKDYFLLLEVKN